MQLVTTEGIEIDFEKSVQSNSLYITGGSFSGLSVIGNIEPITSSVSCSTEGEHSLQVYLNAYNSKVYIEIDKDVQDSCIPQTFHLGGLLITCDDCGNVTINSALQPENPCIEYKRPFSSAFDVAFNKITAQYDICSIIPGVIEFGLDWNCDFAIQGQDIICPAP